MTYKPGTIVKMVRAGPGNVPGNWEGTWGIVTPVSRTFATTGERVYRRALFYDPKTHQWALWYVHPDTGNTRPVASADWDKACLTIGDAFERNAVTAPNGEEPGGCDAAKDLAVGFLASWALDVLTTRSTTTSRHYRTDEGREMDKQLKLGTLVEITNPADFGIGAYWKGAWGVLIKRASVGESSHFTGIFYGSDQKWVKWAVRPSTVHVVAQLDWEQVNAHGIATVFEEKDAFVLADGYLSAGLAETIRSRRLSKLPTGWVIRPEVAFEKALEKVNQALHQGTLPPQEGTDMARIFAISSVEVQDGWVGQLRYDNAIVWQSEPVAADSITEEDRKKYGTRDDTDILSLKAMALADVQEKALVKSWFTNPPSSGSSSSGSRK